MKLERFVRLARAFGAQLDRWPAEERLGASRYLARSVEAGRILSDERKLDRALDRVRSEISQEQVERVWARIADRLPSAVPVRSGPWQRVRPHMPAAAFLTAMWVVGFAVGSWNSMLAGSSTDTSFGSYVTSSFYSQSSLVAWIK